MVVHGGGFVSGARNSEDMVTLATRFAHRGYAVASVSYRLTMKGVGFGCDVATPRKITAINDASDDVGLAIRFILEHEDEFKVDRSKLILFGSSAGAETVLNMAYVYQNDVLPAGFKYAGIISLAGAVTTLDRIDHQSAVPTQFFHGTGDELVPYDVAPHHYCNSADPGYMMLHGSKAMADRLRGLGVSYYLYSVKGGSHLWATLPMTKAFDEMLDFLYHDVLGGGVNRQTERLLSY
ncbi:MAG: alpha/beta hydrolase [Bacteroidota bacterium]